MREDVRQKSNDALPAGLSAPARRALVSAGIATLTQLMGLTESRLLELHSMGPKAIGQLKAAMEARGLSFKK